MKNAQIELKHRLEKILNVQWQKSKILKMWPNGDDVVCLIERREKLVFVEFQARPGLDDVLMYWVEVLSTQPAVKEYFQEV